MPVAGFGNMRLDHAGTDGLHLGAQFFVHGLAIVRADDGAAGAGKIRAGTALPRNLHHLNLPRRKFVNAAPDVEIFIHQLRQPLRVLVKNCFATKVGDFRQPFHGADDLGIAIVETSADVVVEISRSAR